MINDAGSAIVGQWSTDDNAVQLRAWPTTSFLVFFNVALHRRGLVDPIMAAHVTFAVFAAGGFANERARHKQS